MSHLVTPPHAHPATPSSPATTRLPWSTTGILGGAAVLAVAVNALVAAIGVQTGADHAFGPLQLPVFGLFTVAGLLAGWVGWSMLLRRARQPRTTLRIVVPVAVIASFTPDLVLLATRFIPHSNLAGVLALMTMHLVVAVVGVPAYAAASHRRRR
ncbi:DUF6069 family protein [Flexivirga caeni]|uniref:Uncharacterized protein n=1 Tax=Flexivirga caeni TaxID=2294115 RepID=A0A3M9M606_9MICO|nr:DUF6069 family protein [Flexivirga caeni]RNI20647.1 hypothetical protein EFY87_13715 [Flexivirga caeni]